jgi:hypothetical protein
VSVVQTTGSLLASGGSHRTRHDSRSPADTVLAQLMEVILMVTVLPEESLLHAARLLQAAADQAEDDTRSGRASYVTEADVKVLLWLCGSLLGEGGDLRSTSPTGQPLRVLLQGAESELRRCPIGDYPSGTLDVVVGLCDLIRGNRA